MTLTAVAPEVLETLEALSAQTTLQEMLAARDDPMTAVWELEWLTDLAAVPDDAAVPLAMSPPHPRATGSYGWDCIAWAKREFKVTLRWWQALSVVRQLEHDQDGLLVWREIIETGPRRIGKSVRLRIVALWRLQHAHLFGETQLTMLCSKDLAVGKEIHRGAWRWAEDHDWKVTRLNGGQEIETPDEHRWLLRAPTSVYGYDVCYGQCDEAWGVDPQAITDGLEPALLERVSPQLHLTSTAHVKASSLMRRRLVAALRNSDQDVLLLMWGAKPGADLQSPQTWQASSPHWSDARLELVRRKFNAALAGQSDPEFDDPDPVRGWGSQYLNVWPLLTASSVSVLPNWTLCAYEGKEPQAQALGLAVDVGRTWISLGAASTDPNPFLGAVMRERLNAKGRQKVFAQITESRLPVAIDKKGPASTFEDALTELGADVLMVGLDDYAVACARVQDGIEAKEIIHGHHDDLNEAVSNAGWRPVGGDRRVWSRKSGDVSMLEAATLALRVAENPDDYDVLDSVG